MISSEGARPLSGVSVALKASLLAAQKAGFQVEGLNAKPPIVQLTREAPRAAG